MRRRVFLMAVAGAATGCFRERKPQLHILNWENYVAAETIPDFEREFHCRVRYGTYGGNEEMLSKVMSGNSGWDVVFPSNSYVQPMLELGLLLPLDAKRVPNIRNLAPEFRAPVWDPKHEFSVPYMFSGTGIVYSQSAEHLPLSWADMWTNHYHGRMTMMDDPEEVFGACLKRLGDSLNSVDLEQMKRARDLGLQQKPLLRAYLSEEVRDQVVAGDVLVAQMWAQVAQVAIDSSDKLAFTFPSEGFALYADNIAILRESQQLDLAHEFVNYMNRAAVAAVICKEMRTATANGEARALLPERDRSNQVLYPSAQILKRGEWFRPLPANVRRVRDRYWTEIRSA